MKHFLIIGGGIAGYSLAIALLNKNQRVTLLDSDENHGSAVAVGQINPMVFRRMNKSWRLDEYMPVARSFFENLEDFSKKKIIVDKQIRRLFAHDQEREAWLERQELPEYSAYLETVTKEDMDFDKAINICGSGRVKQSYYIHAENFLSAAQQFVSEHEMGAYRTEKIEHSDIDPHKLVYKGVAYSGITFCEGYKNYENPFFNFLPIDCTKGQLITIESDLYETESLNRKCFVMPLGNKQYKVGSTYEWNNPELNTTPEARETLIDHFTKLIDTSFEVKSQIAGIRPTTKDRRPIMGKHPEHESLYFYNGLGAKGYMMAPLLGQEMCDYILEGKELHKEVRLERIKQKSKA